MDIEDQNQAFEDACRAFRKAREAHLATLREAVRGGPHDHDAAVAETHEMLRLHADFMEKFVHRRAV
ncbi:MAG TPA: hypothetical protein VMU47_04470 [Caldimonas sp.]|nr:hypothetical protein [Caldimonas sp.]